MRTYRSTSSHSELGRRNAAPRRGEHLHKRMRVNPGPPANHLESHRLTSYQIPGRRRLLLSYLFQSFHC